MLGQHVVPRKRPKHGLTVRTGRHEPDNSWAVLCLGQARSPCRGPGHQTTGFLANYTQDNGSPSQRKKKSSYLYCPGYYIYSRCLLLDTDLLSSTGSLLEQIRSYMSSPLYINFVQKGNDTENERHLENYRLLPWRS